MNQWAETENPYDLLQLPFQATDKQIKKAYRSAALQCHPDKNPDDPDADTKFTKLTEAFEFLSNKERRAEYDLQRANLERRRHLFEIVSVEKRRFRERLDAEENCRHSKNKNARDCLDHIKKETENLLAAKARDMRKKQRNQSIICGFTSPDGTVPSKKKTVDSSRITVENVCKNRTEDRSYVTHLYSNFDFAAYEDKILNEIWTISNESNRNI